MGFDPSLVEKLPRDIHWTLWTFDIMNDKEPISVSQMNLKNWININLN